MHQRSGGTWRFFSTAMLLLALPLPTLGQEPTPPTEQRPQPSRELPEDFAIDESLLQELTPEQRRQFEQMIRELQAAEGEEIVAPIIGASDDADAAPDEEPEPADVDDHLTREQKRQQAEALIAELAGADEARVAAIELELAALGEVSLVPLKLAALGDDFELRSRAGGMARRLRWRLVCEARLLAELPQLPAVMAGEEQQVRRELVDDLVTLGGRNAIDFFTECLADRDTYIRERGIDGLVAVGGSGNKAAAVAALERAALTLNDDSVVLLAVAGLGELKDVDIAVLTELFEKTDSAEVQRTVLLTAGFSRNPRAIDLIERALKDPRWRVRAAGLEALEDIKSNADKSRMAELVMPLLADPEPFIAATALRLVTELELPGAANIVFEQMASGQMGRLAGLEILAGIEDPRAKQMILDDYRTATDAADHDQANRWLAMLRNYYEDADITRLVEQVLADENRRAQWPTALMLAAWMDENPRLPSLIAAKLVDDDLALRRAAWEVIADFMLFNENVIPASIDQQLAAGDAEQRSWRLQTHFMDFGADPTPVLIAALADPDPAVLNLALGMLGQLKVGYSLGLEDRVLARDQFDSDPFSDRAFDGDSPAPAPSKTADPLLVPGPDNPLVALLNHDDIPARTRAATLLYLTEADRGEKVVAVLRSALQSDLPELQSLALRAATTEPGELVAGVDVAALMNGGTLGPEGVQSAAIVVLLTTGDVEAVAAVVDDIDFYDGSDFFVLLATSGNDKALDLLRERVRTDSGYRVRQFMEQLVREDIAAATALMPAFAENPGTDEWDLQSVIEVMLELDDPAVIPVLEAELARRSEGASNQFRRDYMVQLIEERLIALDPERATKMIGQTLSGEPFEQQMAIARLTGLEPTQTLVDLVFAAIQQKPDPAVEQWADVALWLANPQAEPYRQRFVDAMSDLPGPMQAQLLKDTPIHLGDQDAGLSFDALLAVKANSPEARSRIEMIVAQYTTIHPKSRPADAAAFTALPDAAKAYLLSAAGQWGGAGEGGKSGGEALIRPYLDHDNAELAAAALRGLAIHYLLIETPQLDEPDLERFAAGVTHGDEFTAYLAAEVLYQFSSQRLLQIDADDITSTPALLRYAAASDQRLPGRADQVLIAALRENQDANNTLLRLALVAAVNQNQPRIFRIVGEETLAGHGDLLRRMAMEQEQFQEFIQAVQLGLISPDDAGAAELTALTTRRLLGRGDARLGALVDGGFIKQIATEDLPDYLDAMSRYWASRYQEYAIDTLLSLMDAQDAELEKQLQLVSSSNRDGQMLASMLLWQLTRDQDALVNVLNTAIPDESDQDENPTPASYAALAFLGQADAPDLVPALLSKLKQTTGESWQARNARQQLLYAAMQIDPDAVRQFLLARQAETPDAVLAELEESESWSDLPEQLNLLVFDRPDYDQLRIGPEQDTLSAQFQSVVNEPAGNRAMAPPWGYYSPLTLPELGARDGQAELLSAAEAVKQGIQWQEGTGYYDVDEAGYVGQPLAWFLPRQRHEIDDSHLYYWMRQDAEVTPATLHYLYPGLPAMSHTLTADPARVADTLRSLLDDKNPFTVVQGIRAVVDWKAMDLAPQLFSMIDRGDAVGIEAAWASAMLLGNDAREPIAARLKRETDFQSRVELACLLVLLGDTPAMHEDLQTFGHLLTAQRLRGRAMTTRQWVTAVSDHDAHWEDVSLYALGDGDTDLIDSDLGLLYAALIAMPGEMPTMARLDFPPADQQVRGDRPTGTLPPLARPGAVELIEQVDHRLSLSGLPTHGLPLADLVGSQAPMFAELPRIEEQLFKLTFNQLATTSNDAAALRAQWQAWLAEHGGKDPGTMWRLGIESAVGDLTAEHWWNRMIALARVERLTGHTIQPPKLFESEQWAELQQQWQLWLGTDAAATPRTAIVGFAHDAGRVDADTAATILVGGAESDAAYLDLLVTLAGWGDFAQSRAALHQLDHWPDGPALLRAAARWQISPRPELRAWYLNHAATSPRIYVHADELPAE